LKEVIATLKTGKTFKKNIDILKSSLKFRVQSLKLRNQSGTWNLKPETAQDKAGAWKK
jgi:hypothetical protein